MSVTDSTEQGYKKIYETSARKFITTGTGWLPPQSWDDDWTKLVPSQHIRDALPPLCAEYGLTLHTDAETGQMSIVATPENFRDNIATKFDNAQLGRSGANRGASHIRG